jgi:hypothetical protein
LAIAATNANQTEGNSGTKAFTFTVTRTVNTTGTNAVNWAVTVSGTNPANAADFSGGILPSGIVTFAAGETSKVITVNVQGDTTIEPDENFTVTLSNPTNGATLTTATAIGSIRNDDIQSSPTELQFGLNQTIYTTGDTLTLTGAWVKDLNGSGDLARVDMWIKPASGNWIDVSDVTAFTPWSGGGEWSSFLYSLDLSVYRPDTYTLWAQASDRAGGKSNVVTKTFSLIGSTLNSAPTDLQFNLNKSTYNAGETLALTGAWVKDINGSNDLARIDVWVQKPNQQWINLNDVTGFTPWTGGNDWGGFNYSLNLANYAPGTYTLWARAFDRSGTASNEITRSFQVQNAAPTDLQFNLNKSTYNTRENLALTNAWVKDFNGSDDLTRVDMWIKPANGNWINLSDATTFTPWSGGAEWGGFDYSLSLGSYTPGSYTLWGQAWDQSGAVSNEVSRSFDLISATNPSSLG